MKKIPKLRFKEFNDKLKEKYVSELGSFLGGGTPTTSYEEYWNGDIPWISSSDLFENNIFQVNIKKYITQEAIINSATKLIPKNSILIVSRVGVGKISINKKELCTSQDFINLIPLKTLDTRYLAYNIKTKLSKLISLNQGTSIKGITKKDLQDIKIQISNIQEQKKIADFLSSVDVRIDLTSQKLKLFEKYKKGITQKIFDQELKFKNSEGNNHPEWEEKKLDDIFKVSSSNISQNSLENNQGIYIIYGATGKIKKVDFYDKENEYIGIVKDGAGVGRSFFCEKKTSVLSTLNYLDVINKNNLKFCYYILNRIDFTKYIVGSSIPHIYFKDYKNEKINLPCLEEQQKIADFLSSIDNKIEKLSYKLGELKDFKKGLLQQMFV